MDVRIREANKFSLLAFADIKRMLITPTLFFPIILCVMTIRDSKDRNFTLHLSPIRVNRTIPFTLGESPPNISGRTVFDLRVPTAARAAALENLTPPVVVSTQSVTNETKKIDGSTENLLPKRLHLEPMDGTEPKAKTWRNKSSEAALRERYLHENYVAKLLGCTTLDDYDRGVKPICNEKCKFGCQAKFALLKDALRDEMEAWWGEGITKQHRKIMLHDETKENALKLEGNPTFKFRYFIQTRQVCRNFYLRCRGIVSSTLHSAQQDVQQNKCSNLSVGENKISFKETNSKGKTEIKCWIEQYGSQCGDKMPHEQVTVLPYRNIKPIYEEYEADIQESKPTDAKKKCRSYFYRTFNKACAELKMRLARNTGDFLNCTVCDAYDEQLRKAKTMEDRDAIKFYRSRHKQKQATQREKYYKHRNKANTMKHRYLSIIIDGMDQKKTNVPITGRAVKDPSPLTQRIIGAKVHGHGNYAFIVDETVPGGANLICEVLRLILKDLENKGALPHDRPVLYLQVDNCGENKNKTMFAFLTDLVRQKVFHKIKAGFLMVGHTHEDIDQFFSVISSYLKQIHIFCPDQASLFAAIGNAFTDPLEKPTVIELKAPCLPDYTRFYEKYIDPNIHHHQQPHQFRIKCYCLGTDKEVVLLNYKNWSNSSVWLPQPPQCSDSSPPRKKQYRGQMTRGQKADQIRSAFTEQPKKMRSKVTELLDSFETPIDAEFEDLQSCQEDHKSATSSLLAGILWLRAPTSFQSFPLVQYDPQTINANYKRALKIHEDVISKFSKRYTDVFSDQILQNWDVWRSEQMHMWNLNTKRSECLPVLSLPAPYLARQQPIQRPLSTVQDVSLPDFCDTVEYVTHSSGRYGTFTKKQRNDLIVDSAVKISDNFPVMVNTGCIYQFTYPDKKKRVDVNQIAFGIVEKCHAGIEEGEYLYDIRFCPPQGAKAQTAHRPDTLYQDINEEMKFNLHYKKSEGPKGHKIRVKDIETNQPRSILLAWNLQVNSDGTLSSQPLQSTELGISSRAFASVAIKEFYERRNASTL